MRSSQEELRHDVWLQDAIRYAVHSHWLEEAEQAFGEAGQVAKAIVVATQMRQIAADGKFLIWGKKPVGRLYEIIPPEFWAENQIETMHLLAGKAANVRTEPAGYIPHPVIYRGLMVNKSQAEKQWPV